MKNLISTTVFFSVLSVILCSQFSCKKKNICNEVNGKCFSIPRFGDNLQTRLKATSLGHAYTIYYDNSLQKWDQNGEGRRSQDGNVYNINAINTEMNVASCAKSMTTIALLKALEQAGVSVDAKIKDYLPQWWTFGSNIELISFKDCLRMRSGFLPTSKAENYAEIQRFVMLGINATDHGQEHYENMNFCIFRIIIPILSGDFDKNNQISDAAADALTQDKFMQYMQKKVWDPVGAVGYCNNPDDVLYYDWVNPTRLGLNPGNECENTGGGTISMSTNNLAKVMYNARYTDKLLTPAQRDLMFNISQPLGCYNSNVNTAQDWPGQFHHNGGFWKSFNPLDTLGAASCWYTFPNGVVVAVATNSYGGLRRMGYQDINDLIERSFDDAWE